MGAHGVGCIPLTSHFALSQKVFPGNVVVFLDASMDNYLLKGSLAKIR